MLIWSMPAPWHDCISEREPCQGSNVLVLTVYWVHKVKLIPFSHLQRFVEYSRPSPMLGHAPVLRSRPPETYFFVPEAAGVADFLVAGVTGLRVLTYSNRR